MNKLEFFVIHLFLTESAVQEARVTISRSFETPRLKEENGFELPVFIARLLDSGTRRLSASARY